MLLDNAHLSRNGQEKHQRRLVYFILSLVTSYFLIIGLLNVVLFQEYPTAVLDFIGGTGAGWFLRYFHRSQDLKTASWGIIAVLIPVMLIFIHIADGRAYSLIWVTVIPPLTFFLLGRRAGAFVSGIVFIYITAFVYLRLPSWQPIKPGLGTLLNIIEVFIAHWFLFQMYERSRSEAFEELEVLSVTDKLTGLYNRSRLDTLLNDEIVKHERSGHPMTVILCDVDHFKLINDEHGHLVGDEILKGIAAFLVEQCRQADACGRWGGEEFLIICPDTKVSDAVHLIERIQWTSKNQSLAQDINVTLSYGIAGLTPEDDTEQLMRKADTALYEAKRQGRDRYIIAE